MISVEKDIIIGVIFNLPMSSFIFCARDNEDEESEKQMFDIR